MRMRLTNNNGWMFAACVLIGLGGLGVQATRACEWNGEFPSMMCAAGSSFAQFLGVTGVASLVGGVVARRWGAAEESLTFVGALCGAALVFALLSVSL